MVLIQDPFPRFYARLSPTTRKKWNQNWNQLLFWTWNQWRSREKKSKVTYAIGIDTEINGRGDRI